MELENGLATSDGTKVLTVQEFDTLLSVMPQKLSTIFEIATIKECDMLSFKDFMIILNGITRYGTKLFFLKKHSSR